MNKYLFLIIVCILFSLSSGYASLIVIWTQEYDNGSTERARDIVSDNNGYVYVSGYRGSPREYFTIKYNLDGNTVWTQLYYSGYMDCMAYGIAIDQNYNVYVTGEADISGALGTAYITVKYDQSGNSVQTQIYTNRYYYYNYAYDIVVDNSDNIYVTGRRRYSVTFNDYYTIKYDSSGNTIWTQRYGTNITTYNGIALDDSDDVYISGATEKTDGGNRYITAIKYDGNTGNAIWTNSSLLGVGYSCAVDNNNYLYVASKKGNGYYTVKFDSSGNTIWTQQYSHINSMGPYDIVIDQFNYIYITGYKHNGVDNDFFTVKYDSNGVLQWEQVYNGGDSDIAYGIAIDNNGYVYVTGEKDNGVNSDYFTIKYLQPPYPPSLSLSAELQSDLNTIKLSWQENIINETGYKIYRKKNNASFLIIARVSSGPTVFDDTDLSYACSYQYKIVATNAAGESEPSNIAVYNYVYTISINDIILVPNPFNPQISAKSYITFYRVPTGTWIIVYSVSGEEMIHLDQVDEENKIVWDVCDEEKQLLPRGLYMAKIINNKGDSRLIKFVVEY